MTVYRVTGATPFRGVKPGETFEAELDPEQEARAVARGQIRKLRTPKPKEEEVDGDAEEDRAQRLDRG